MTATLEQFGDGSATREAAILSLNDQVVAFLQPGALERTWNHVAGDLSGRQILRLRLHDLIVHGWDIEETLRSRATLPDDLVQWGLHELVQDDSLAARDLELVDLTGLRSPDDGATAYLGVFGR